MSEMSEKKVALIILDGFGLGDGGKGDAIAKANKPCLDKLLSEQKYAQLKTHGEAVGLPAFQTGGSEVGHITLGAGRPIKQLLTKINDLIEKGDFFENEILVDLFTRAKQKGRIHFMGLISDGGIHSFQAHVFGLQKMAEKFGIENAYLHAFTDGRDVEERTAKNYLAELRQNGLGKLATIGGRFFAMDRDQNWDRIEQSYRSMTDPSIEVCQKTAEDFVDDFYASGEESDYYLPPACFDREGQIREEDIVIFFNFRSDRARQICEALTSEAFMHFERPVKILRKNLGVFGSYCEGALMPFSFGKESLANTLGEVMQQREKTQLRISETEKFNHVTFFFSGEKKTEFIGEDRILIPSKKCRSYAEAPGMSAVEQSEALIKAITKKPYDLVVQNFANADLVGHSGNIEAAQKSVEILDTCLKKIIPVLQEKGYYVLITADHGNSDEMILANGEMSAAHSKNLVPCWALDTSGQSLIQKDEGTLADIAPTILDLMHIEKPKEMTGVSLVR